ncbi:MAG: hypothetical protein CMN21_20615 [Rubinisphaera sp.]|uniref:hypothetical protein n=2 Tax=Rubinisphaera TaxID=1649490 RepID=UPI000C0E2AC1|nr:hypothetical protein [Rubinisphaera sp.]MBV11607.1 hypothetical protein [Rubinisphaera sp.]|tara:strand:+ start:17027 stop:20032 length:3006 start_codon:yes stop_codon:yes gene_type:complete
MKNNFTPCRPHGLLIAAALLLLNLPASLEAQVSLELDQFGYPQQGFKHQKTVIEFPKIQSVGTFGWVPEEHQFNKIVRPQLRDTLLEEETINQLRMQVIPLSNVTSTIQGQWRLANKGRQGANQATSEIAVSSTKSVSKSQAFQLGAELSASTTVGFKPFGVGADVTLEASIGYAFSQQSGITNSRTWNPSFPFEFGQDIQVWQRVIRVTDSFDPARIFQPKPGESHTAEDAFLLAMGETYGPILWPKDEYGFNSYAHATNKSRFHGRDVSGFKRELQQTLDTNPNHTKHIGNDATLWRTLEILFDYSQFVNLGFQDNDRYLPSPEYYPTYSNFNSPRQPVSTDLALIMTESAGSRPELNQDGYPKGDRRYSTYQFGAKRNVTSDTFRWLIPKGSLKKMMFKKDGKSDIYKAVIDQYQNDGLLKKIADQGVLLPNIEMVSYGMWTLAGNQRCPPDAPEPLSLTASNAIEVSSETAHEVSVGFSASVTGAGKPLGVGAETTLTASVNAAVQVANGTGSSEEWSRSESVLPGQHMYMWQQFLTVSTDFVPIDVFKAGRDQHGEYSDRDAFVCAFAESYGPIIWPQSEFGPNSYKDVTRDLRQNGPVSTTLLIRRLNQIKAPGLRGNIKQLKTPLSSIIFTIFDFDEFKKFERQRSEHRLPFPEFYPTTFDYQNVKSQSPAITTAPPMSPQSGQVESCKSQFIAALNDPSVPALAKEKGNEFLKSVDLRSVAFDPNGVFSIVGENRAFWNSGGIPEELHPFMLKLNSDGTELKSAGLTPTGGFNLIYGDKYWNRGIPDAAHQATLRVINEGGKLKSMCFSQDGGWCLIYNKNSFQAVGIPEELVRAMAQKQKAGETIQTIVFTPNGNWYLIATGEAVSGKSQDNVTNTVVAPPRTMAPQTSRTGVKETLAGFWRDDWDQGTIEISAKGEGMLAVLKRENQPHGWKSCFLKPSANGKYEVKFYSDELGNNFLGNIGVLTASTETDSGKKIIRFSNDFTWSEIKTR